MSGEHSRRGRRLPDQKTMEKAAEPSRVFIAGGLSERGIKGIKFCTTKCGYFSCGYKYPSGSGKCKKTGCEVVVKGTPCELGE